jgi:hypothetical protein
MARKPRRHFTLNILKCERLLIYYCMSKTHPAIGYNRWPKSKTLCKCLTANVSETYQRVHQGQFFDGPVLGRSQMRGQAFPVPFLGRIKVPACAVKTKLDTRRESFCLSFGQAVCLPAITIIILFIVQIEINFFYGIFKEAATQITPSRETAGCEFGSRIRLVV